MIEPGSVAFQVREGYTGLAAYRSEGIPPVGSATHALQGWSGISRDPVDNELGAARSGHLRDSLHL